MKMNIVTTLLTVALCGTAFADYGCQEPEIENGGYTSEYGYDFGPGTVVHFYCDKGYKLQPPHVKSAVCKKYGYKLQWKPSVPICIKEVYKCPAPEVPAYGSYSPSKPYYIYPQTITYTCDYGYTLTPATNAVRKCLKNGEWDREAPKCKPKKCPPRNKPKYGSLKPDKKYYEVGDKITFYCLGGYYLHGTAMDTCTKFGTWAVNKDPVCLKKCKINYDIENGAYHPVKTYYHPGDVVTFSCSKQYCLQGHDDFTCKKGGSWYPQPFPKCAPRCFPEKILYGGIINAKFSYCPGEYIKFYCDEDYTNVGDKEARCKLDGGWSGRPICKPVVKKCKKPTIKYGGVDPDQYWYHAGAEVEFYCHTGYKLVGYSSAKCVGKTGQWNREIPYCKKDKRRLCKNIGCGYSDYYESGCQCHYRCRWFKNCCEDFEDVCLGYEVPIW